MVTGMEKGSSYGFAVLKGKNQDLLQMFDQGLSNLKNSGKYQAILDKYIAVE
jgi:polar amino acid transport system substrate-binding protein